MSKLRLATRRSLLARTQTTWVAERLRGMHPGLECELVEVRTRGDLDQQSALDEIPEVGVFTQRLQEAVLEGRADVAVHSLKDLPVKSTPGLVVAALPEREDPRDVLVSRGDVRLADLPAGARVGTGSPRRARQLLEIRPDIAVQPIRGNVDTRLRKVATGEYVAAVLALAGLIRLGRTGEATETLDFLPAPGQGALAVECRSADDGTISLVRTINDRPTEIAVTAERLWLAATGGGCQTTAAAHAVTDGRGIELQWFLDGERGEETGPLADADALAVRAGEAARTAAQEAARRGTPV